VKEVLDRVNLQEAEKKYPAEISGGMKKRVGIARAIVLNPKYLFCDEPNSGLDPQTSLVIEKLIKELTVDYNINTVVKTHDMKSVMEISSRLEPKTMQLVIAKWKPEPARAWRPACTGCDSSIRGG